MRPIHLTLSAFGSYGGVEEISFQEQSQGLFLIAGDTGSGKTTIFDGIMFALYGKLSGKERESNMMRSEYASEDRETWVEFTFSYKDQTGDKQYKIRRSPTYTRKSKRKNKDGQYTETKQGGTACLTLPDGKELTKLREIGEKIEEIIGLTCDQFGKIAMIAQGEFQELIMDKTGKRKEIFQKIFETRIYEQIELEIWDRFKKEYANQKENMTQMTTTLEGAKLPEDSEFREKWNEALAKMDTEPELLEHLYEELLAEQKAAQKSQEQLRQEAHEKWEKGKQLRGSQVELEKLVQNQGDLTLRLAQAQETLEESKGGYEAFAKAFEREKKVLDEKSYQLREQLPEYKKRDEEKKELQNLISKEAELQQSLDELRHAGEALLQEQQELEAAEIREEDGKLEEQKLNQEEEILSRKERIVAEAKENYPKLVELQEKLATAQQRCIDVEADYETARREKEEMDRRYIAAQAGLLATQLQKGTPCPVCGSVEHPNPCQLSEETTVHEADVEAARQKEQVVESLRNQAVAEASDLRSQYDVKESEFRSDLRELAPEITVETAEDRLQMLMEDLKKERQELEARIRACQEQIKAQEKRKERRQELAELLPKNAEEQKKVELTWEQMKISKKVAEEKCQAWQESLLYASLKEAEAGLQMLTQQGEALEKEQTTWKTKLEGDKERVDGLGGQLEQCRENVEEKRTTLARQWEAWECPEEMCNDAETLAQWEKSLEMAWKEASGAYEEAKLMYDSNRETFRKWKEKKKEREAVRKKYQVLKSLHDAARGKVYFQTYIQRHYFKQIIRAANQRLSKMNANQFLLACRELGAGSGQGQQGLELDVINPLTEKRRDAHTLSGGETFMASLAMALGLADVVQSQVGGTRLETMFIDEGFGSLSEEVRNMAVRVLLELADGNRLVGVVSHVTELKEQIPRKLLVTKDSAGSHTRWEMD